MIITQKIGSDGQYKSFPGYSVIAPIVPADVWRNIFACLSLGGTTKANICDYYSPLPLESYHMTIFNLFTKQYEGGKDWEGFVRNNDAFLSSLHHYFESHPIHLNITIDNVYLGDVIQLIVSLPEKQKKALEDIAVYHHLQNHMPRHFHITLAYQYRDIPRHLRNQLAKNIYNNFNTVFCNIPSDLTLQPPALHYFADMTSFIPWATHKQQRVNAISSLNFFTNNVEESKTDNTENNQLSNCIIS